MSSNRESTQPNVVIIPFEKQHHKIDNIIASLLFRHKVKCDTARTKLTELKCDRGVRIVPE